MSISGPPPGRLTDEELREMSAYYLGQVRQAWNTVYSKLVAGEQLDAQTYFDLAGEAIRQLEDFSPQYPQEKREPFKRHGVPDDDRRGAAVDEDPPPLRRRVVEG